jgi:hypothetical protein
MKLNFKKAATKVLTVGGGATVSRFAGNSYAKTMAAPVKGLIHIAAGAFLIPMLAKGDIGEGIGNGFIAEGALRIAESKMPDKFAVSGISQDQLGATRDYVIDEDRVHGPGDANMGDIDGINDSNLGAISENQIAGDDMSGLEDM